MKELFNRTGFIERDGFKLNYCIEGNGPPAIVIGSSLYYPRVFSSNLRKHIQFIFTDHRGFAPRYNNQPDAFTLSTLLEDIETLRKHLKLEKMMVIGHSIHALIALEYAKKYPRHVEALIMVASAPGSDHAAANRYFEESVSPERKALLEQNLKTMSDEIAKHPDAAFIIRMLTFGPMIWYDWKYDASTLWEGVRLNPHGASVIWGAMFDQYDIIHDLKRIVCPVFLALGRYDYWNPPHLWEPFRSCFHSLTIRVFEKSGHTPSFEEPALFDTELLGWIRDKVSTSTCL